MRKVETLTPSALEGRGVKVNEITTPMKLATQQLCMSFKPTGAPDCHGGYLA